MDTKVLRAAQWTAVAVLTLVLVSILPTPREWVPQTDTVKRFRRYLVSVPANSIVNFTGWTQTYVPLGVALFGSRPYLLNFGR